MRTKRCSETVFTAVFAAALLLPVASGFAATGAQVSRFWNASDAIAATQTAQPESSAVAGGVTHNIYHVEALHAIPTWRAVPMHRQYARETAARPGQIWYIVRGSSFNGTQDTRGFRSNDIDIIDTNGKEYQASWSPSLFLPESLSLRSAELNPGDYKHWLAFFELPEDLAGPQLRAGNLPRIEPEFGTLDLDGFETSIEKPVGSIHHRVHQVHQMSEIPANWTIEKYQSKAEPKPAKPDMQWLVLSGTTLNNGQDARRLSAREFTIMDADGNEFRSVSPGYKYQDTNTRLNSEWMEPGASVDWKLFFEVPATLQGPLLRVGNLKQARGETTTLALPDSTALLQALESVPDANPTAPASSASTDVNMIDLGNTTVVTGEVAHVLISAEVMSSIPSERMNAEWKERGMSEALPAPENTVWVHVTGSSTNTAAEERSFNATFSLIDSTNREFQVNVSDTQFYVEDDRSVLYTQIQPGESRVWEAWFLVHSDAENLRLKLDDLTLLAEFTAETELPIENALIKNRGAVQ